jgi:hypothetical protein
MTGITKVIETHKRTILGTIVGGIGGYYLATKALKAESKIGVGLTVVLGAIVGSVAQDKFFGKKTKITVNKTATADVIR